MLAKFLEQKNNIHEMVIVFNFKTRRIKSDAKTENKKHLKATKAFDSRKA